MKKYSNPDKNQWSEITARPVQSFEEIEGLVKEVFEAVKTSGDSALATYTQKFDDVNLDALQVSGEEFTSAENEVSTELKEAIKVAKNNIEKFHKAQRTKRVELETMPGVHCWQEKRPIEKVGLYIPGGTAPLFSTILMLAIPAKIAGCKQIVLCSPPNREGKLDPCIVYAARLCGVTEVFKVGGIQAIAAMTFGTESIPGCFKIFGPGNQYVTVAKQWATKYGAAIDMPAGPSELLVLADETADPAFVASDLLSQAEHGSDSQVILVTNSQILIKEVTSEIEKQLEQLPRKQLAEKAIANSKLIFIDNDDVTLEFINEYAPEHFIVYVKNEDFFVKNVRNAGSVFIGAYTPESAGDYASGTNHTLPTNGYAKQYSGVGLESFTKRITFQKITADGMVELGPTIEVMAEAEGLQAHKNAVSLRLKKLKVQNR